VNVSILGRLKRVFAGREPAPEAREGGEFHPARFVYVMLPEPTEPIERGDKYEDPLDLLLNEAGLGEITGGGSQLGDPQPDGTPTVEFCGLDVTVTDLDGALALLRTHLPRLGAPVGTEIHYTLDGARLQDELASGGWSIARVRTSLHPYFGC
jgi:hypothetical protein